MAVILAAFMAELRFWINLRKDQRLNMSSSKTIEKNDTKMETARKQSNIIYFSSFIHEDDNKKTEKMIPKWKRRKIKVILFILVRLSMKVVVRRQKK